MLDTTHCRQAVVSSVVRLHTGPEEMESDTTYGCSDILRQELQVGLDVAALAPVVYITMTKSLMSHF